jgi:hypothetical protein
MNKINQVAQNRTKPYGTQQSRSESQRTQFRPMNSFITFSSCLWLLLVTSSNLAHADPLSTLIASEQQAFRDREKLNILQNEINEQRQLSAQLQQQKAVALQNDNQAELARIEARLVEVTGNITQIQQEINQAQGNPGPINPVTVKLTPAQADDHIKTVSRADKTANNPAAPWWDLYNKREK